MSHLRSNGSQHEPNKNPGPLQELKVIQTDRILDPNEPQNFPMESASVAKMINTYRRLFPDSKGYWRLHGHQEER